MTELKSNNPKSWTETVWAALADYRNSSIPEGTPEYDAEWEEICTAMAWIEEEVIDTADDNADTPEDKAEDKLKSFDVSLAYSVRVYGTATIEAVSAEQAAEIVRLRAITGDGEDECIWGCVHDVEHSTASEHSILWIEAEDGTTTGEQELTKPETPCDIITAEELAEAMK